MTANDSAASAQIDAYLATLPAAMRAALQGLRHAIAAAAPEAVEAISYGAPAFKYRGRPLVSYGAAKHHASFYVMGPAVMDAHATLVAPYDTSKGTVQFPLRRHSRPISSRPWSGPGWRRRTLPQIADHPARRHVADPR